MKSVIWRAIMNDISNIRVAPAKLTDTRTANWDGIGQVELDAVKPEQLTKMAEDAIESVFDRDLYEELLEQTATERVQYRAELKEFVNNLKD